MKRILLTGIGIISGLFYSLAFGQEQDSLSTMTWNHSLEGSYYIWKNESYFLPVYSVDKDWLHLEARYNYEDMNTFSAWFGYNFSGGNKVQYTITPMLGIVAGNSTGIAPGLEFTFDFYGFELYSESEYLFDLQDKENNFFYTWIDFTYSPVDWIWFGLSTQHTKPFQTEREIQKGLTIGGEYKWVGLSAYIYEMKSTSPFLILSLTIRIP